MPAGVTVILLLAVSVSGCSAMLNRQHRRPVFMPQVCQDGAPVQVLQHPTCVPDGFCGYSCLPGRWST